MPFVRRRTGLLDLCDWAYELAGAGGREEGSVRAQDGTVLSPGAPSLDLGLLELSGQGRVRLRELSLGGGLAAVAEVAQPRRPSCGAYDGEGECQRGDRRAIRK